MGIGDCSVVATSKIARDYVGTFFMGGLNEPVAWRWARDHKVERLRWTLTEKEPKDERPAFGRFVCQPLYTHPHEVTEEMVDRGVEVFQRGVRRPFSHPRDTVRNILRAALTTKGEGDV